MPANDRNIKVVTPNRMHIFPLPPSTITNLDPREHVANVQPPDVLAGEACLGLEWLATFCEPLARSFALLSSGSTIWAADSGCFESSSDSFAAVNSPDWCLLVLGLSAGDSLPAAGSCRFGCCPNHSLLRLAPLSLAGRVCAASRSALAAGRTMSSFACD